MIRKRRTTEPQRHGVFFSVSQRLRGSFFRHAKSVTYLDILNTRAISDSYISSSESEVRTEMARLLK